jgi:hypothetical protein
MKIEDGTRRDFWGYLTPLRHLEQAFRAVGMTVDISLHFYSDGIKSITVKSNGDTFPLRINDLIPEKAIKKAACFLISGNYDTYCKEGRV